MTQDSGNKPTDVGEQAGNPQGKTRGPGKAGKRMREALAKAKPIGARPAAEAAGMAASQHPPQLEHKNRITVSGAYAIGLVGGLGVLTAVLIFGVFSKLGTVLIYIGVALFIALGLDPIVTWLERRFSRAIAIVIVLLTAVLIFAGILLLIVPNVITQVSQFIADFPAKIATARQSDFVEHLDKSLAGYVDVDALLQTAQTFIQDPKNILQLGSGLLAVGTGIAQVVTGGLIVLILTLYFLASMRQMKSLACRFVPARRRARYSVLQDEICHAVGRYVVGQASLASVNGVCSFIYLTIIGAPNPILLAIVAFCGSLIPLVGTLSGSIIISLTCLFASPTTALAAAIYYLIYMQVEAYVLSPRIMSKAVSVPGAIVVIAAIAGGTIGGVLGALVAIPVAASAIIIVQKVVFPVQDAKTEAPALTTT